MKFFIWIHRPRTAIAMAFVTEMIENSIPYIMQISKKSYHSPSSHFHLNVCWICVATFSVQTRASLIAAVVGGVSDDDGCEWQHVDTVVETVCSTAWPLENEKPPPCCCLIRSRLFKYCRIYSLYFTKWMVALIKHTQEKHDNEQSTSSIYSSKH